MTQAEFDIIVEERIAKIRKILKSKGDEYATEDRMYNFKRTAQVLDCTPQRALLGFLAKHWVSVMDIIEGKSLTIDEKIGDCINYLILLEALLHDVGSDFHGNGSSRSKKIKRPKN